MPAGNPVVGDFKVGARGGLLRVGADAGSGRGDGFGGQIGRRDRRSVVGGVAVLVA